MKESILVWEKRRIGGNSMPRNELIAEVESFIKNRSNCALATGYGTYIRNTPMRYSFVDGVFHFITEGGLKFKGLSANPHVCIAIYDTNDTSSSTVGVTVEGIAVVTKMPNSDATPKDSEKYMITVTPTTIDYLNYGLPSRGYYQLQKLEYK